MKLIYVDSDIELNIEAKEVDTVIDNIKVARFELNNPEQLALIRDLRLYCGDGDREFESPNDVHIQNSPNDDYFTSEWSEWARCNDVTDRTNRSRSKANGEEVWQSRYCTCSLLKELPSPRYFNCNINLQKH